MAAKSTSGFGSIRNRLLFRTTALATIPLIIVAAVLAYFALNQVKQSLQQRANDQLQSIREGKTAEVQAYFGNAVDSLVVASGTEQVRQALLAMPAALQELPIILEVPTEVARASVGEYYQEQFAAEYERRNAGASTDTAAMLSAQPDYTVAAQYLYISENPNPLGEKGNLDRAPDPSQYSALHQQMHPLGRSVVERYGLYDVFLVDLDGNVVYTFYKELDFTSNLRSGPWAGSGLAQAFEGGLSKNRGEVFLTDYAPYVPSYEDQAIFAGTPVFDGERLIGAYIVQLPIDQVNAIMTFDGQWQNVGLGESGEVYLVGGDNTPRSISRFLFQDVGAFIERMRGLGTSDEVLATMRSKESNIGVMTINTEGTRDALSGNKGVSVFNDYRGEPVLSAYAPLDVLNQRWAIMSEIDAAEANAPAVELQNQMALVAMVAFLVMAGMAVFTALRLARTISTPLLHFGSIVSRVAEGDNEARVLLPPTDEIGQLGGAFDRMMDKRTATQERIEREHEELNNSVIEIMSSVAELAGRDLRIKVPVSEDVTGAVSDAINMMTESTAEALHKVRQIARLVSTASQNVQKRSDQVHGAATASADQATAASSELQQTAVALERMGEEAREANQHAIRALKATGDAMDIVRATVTGISDSRDKIRETEKRIKRLGERSQEITSVVNIIGQIAERTSVLALNASMQAVAAGEAGRGFAVIADEVKRLAENARQATQQISGLVNAIQADTSETIQAMNSTIAQVVDISKLADQAGGQMNDTKSATELLAAAVRSIAESTIRQSEAAKTLLTRAYDLLQSSQNTVSELEAQREDTDSLATSAQDLVTTVGEFQLPN